MKKPEGLTQLTVRIPPDLLVKLHKKAEKEAPQGARPNLNSTIRGILESAVEVAAK